MYSRISCRYSKFVLPLVCLLLIFGISTADSHAQEVVINEVMFFPDTSDTVHERNHEWVELYNYGDPANIDEWVISNRDASSDVVLPPWDFPPSTYLVIHFTTGTDDNDFSDGAGHYYAGNADVFSETMDECALYAGTPSGSTILDFMNWSDAFSYSPGQAHDYAVSVGIWPSEDFFTPVDTADMYAEIAWVMPGESMGRDSSSTDTDSSGDWAVFGGADAIYASPGKVNYQLLQNIPPLKGEKIERRYAAWTVIFYLNGESNLDPHYFRLLDDLETQGSLPNVNVVVLADFKTNYGGNTLRGLLQAHNDSGTVHLDTIAEQNMGAPQTLGGFIYWAQQNYTAGKYVLFIKNHGAGWKGLSKDETSGNDRIYMQELYSALDHSIPPKLDVLVFDACLMAMVEVARQVKQRVEMMVASEETKTVFDFPYNSIFAAMNANPYWTGEQLAVDIVAKAAANAPRRNNYTFSAIDCRNLDPLISQIDNFGGELEWGLDDYDFHYQNHYDRDDNVQIRVRNQLVLTEHFRDANFIDLYHFAQLIKADTEIPDDYKTQAQPITNSLQKGGSIIKAEEHAGHDNAHGLSIYFPSAQTKAAPPVPKQNTPRGERPYDNPWPSHKPDNSALAKYASDPDDCKPPDQPCVNNYTQARNHPCEPTPGFFFVEDTDWDEFLHRYYEPVSDAGEDTTVRIGTNAYLNGVGSSDSDTRPDGTVERYFWDFDSRVDAPPDCPPSADEDWDRDCTDDANDDKDGGENRKATFPCNAPGTYYITLTVWDDHNLQGGTHTQHYETDQDEVVVRCEDTVFSFIPPPDEEQHENGSYESDLFVASGGTGHDVVGVTASCAQTSIANVDIVFTIPPPAGYIEGFVSYDVVDHCQPGGTVEMTVMNDAEETLTGAFEIALTNTSPTITCPPDTSFEYTSGYTGAATAYDEDSDPLAFSKVDGPDGLFVLEDGTIIWETGPGDVGGPYDVTVLVTDICGVTAECSFSLTVTAPVGCCQHAEYCEMLAEEECMSFPGAIWYPSPYQCIDGVCKIYCGDCKQDGVIDLGDLLLIINYLYKSGPAPDPLCIGDVSCDYLVDLGDVLYLVSYLYKGGQSPCEECCFLKAGKEKFPNQEIQGVPRKLPQAPGDLKQIE
ncbi:MAG: hypothetical protein AMJ91_01780 [candidate division Zixibacteria bacterium SM23_73_3]|nr:MAG: hypothetical protein AMJ91_01780 [candidate division Zixibacteria bacterium SM23_73_3]